MPVGVSVLGGVDLRDRKENNQSFLRVIGSPSAPELRRCLPSAAARGRE